MTTTVPLGELVEIRGGGTPSRLVPNYWGGPIPWATVKDFNRHFPCGLSFNVKIG